ncbi:MAG: hypothetical protein E4H46_00510 [Desulfobacterales bacterium]|nr:MAG: hypothetical protein E4H46_00510 [Desulfobacterales bacterium]
MKKASSSEIRLLALLVVVLALVVLGLYFFKFHVSLSEQSADWGNFGSYINGVLSPILLFLTLIYIANTLKAQKESQIKQSKGFSDQLQEMANDNQINQITSLRKEILGLINNEVAFFIKRFDKLQSEISDATKNLPTIKGPTGNFAPAEEAEALMAIAKSNSKEMLNANNRVINLQRLAFNIITGDFKTVNALKKKFETEYKDIDAKFGDFGREKFNK